MSPDPRPAAAPPSSPGVARAGGAGPAAVLWDLDGTVVDTEPFWDRANAELVAAHGGRWTRDDALAVVGSDLLDAAAYVRRECGVDLDPVEIVTTVIARVAEQMAGAPPWQPGVLALLAELRAAAVPSVLVTMSWRPLVDRVVELLPPGTFAATVAGDEVPRGKPHPDPYLAAAAAVGVEPSSCLAIEDSPTGIASARAAGCFVVGVPHLVDLPAADVDALVPTLDGVNLTTLRRLFAR
jgi:HAD superfamily hydrolase (TIGR01509 family)